MWRRMLHCDGCDDPVSDATDLGRYDLEYAAKNARWKREYDRWYCPRCQLARVQGVPSLPLTVEIQ